jgi:hypothetical protein
LAAAFVAHDAHENHFESRSGVYTLTLPSGMEVVAAFNNNPWRDSFSNGVCRRRDSEHSSFLQAMSLLGINELSRASYPAGDNESDELAGYTTVIVLAAASDRRDEVADAYREAIQTGHPHDFFQLLVPYTSV